MLGIINTFITFLLELIKKIIKLLLQPIFLKMDYLKLIL